MALEEELGFEIPDSVVERIAIPSSRCATVSFRELVLLMARR